jgi:hypothetical protein
MIQNTSSRVASEPKQPYRRPVLTNYGTVVELTKGGTATVSDSPAAGGQP